ncbi:MAG: ATP-binding cassette domain-containing protein [Propionibacteriaceae bacterium]|jgi:ATPase subunit of ABC transporter with duplicated ATPase domains|nr:ATP-binding cassette domain-containing protein [Propionibacteriaceae bacterium]
MSVPIIFSHVSFAWPDGAIALDDVSATFGAGRTGLVGANGSGKTTIFRLITGELHPGSGVVTVSGDVAYVPQLITTMPGASVADLLGVADILAALHAIEAGSCDPDHFDTVGERWDIETQADAVLASLDMAGGGLTGADLSRPVTTLSGGEAMVVAIAGCRLRRAAITVLDEPTNNLDEVLRSTVHEMIRTWPGTVIVASHDTALLEQMDAIAELYDGRLSVFGGAYSAWREAMEAEQAAAVQAERTAEQAVRAAKRARVAVLERTARGLARGKQKAVREGVPKIVRDAMRDQAESGAGRARTTGLDKVKEAQSELDQASGRVRADDHIQVDLPDPAVHASRQILELTWGDSDSFSLRGPQRVALAGRNGSGKTTLIEQMLGLREPDTVPDSRIDAPGLCGSRVVGRLLTDRVGYLPQRLDVLDDQASAVENIAAVAPQATQGEIRARLARLLLRGDAVFRPVGALSGGERFRVSLARLLFAEPPAQLLILDEPTNNLDLTSVDQLVEALEAYRGAILVVSHDPVFLSRVHVDVRLDLSDGRIARS